MRLGWVMVFGAGVGAIWGAVWMIVIGVLLMLVSGLIVQPPVTVALILGAFMGVGQFWVTALWRGRAAALVLFGASFVGLMGLTLAHPFGIGLGDGSVYQIVGAVTFAAALSTSAAYGAEWVFRRNRQPLSV